MKESTARIEPVTAQRSRALANRSRYQAGALNSRLTLAQRLVLQRLAAVADDEEATMTQVLTQIDDEAAMLREPAIETLGRYVNPVQQPFDTSDTFGAPRIGHKHEGIDLFAKRGTPVRATVDGVLRDVKETNIGGRIVYVTSPDGTYYYYAHLDRWASGITNGVSVRAGQILGFVGRSGNAEETPPHLHFEMHPLGGPPMNPFPLIDAVRKRDQQGFAVQTVDVQQLCREVADATRPSTTLADLSLQVPTRPIATVIVIRRVRGKTRRIAIPVRTTTSAPPPTTAVPTTTRPPITTSPKPTASPTTIAPGVCRR